MKKFNEFLKEYIVNLASKSIDKNGVDLARILVNGIPFSLAIDFLEELISSGGLKIYDRKIPIVAHDKSIDTWIQPKSEEGGICGKDHVLNLRNSTKVNDIIILLCEGSSLDKSNTTSLIKIGIDQLVNNEDWVNQDMIQFLLEKSLIIVGFGKEEFPDIYKVFCEIIGKYKSSKSHDGDRQDQWNFIKSISSKVSFEKIEQLRSLAGMINEDDRSIFDNTRCEKIFEKIADSFESIGVNASIAEWNKKDLSFDVQKALENFKNHYISVCENAELFRSSPYYYYSRLQWKDINIEWWDTLTVGVWNEILEEVDELHGSCKITIENCLFRNNKPSPIVLDEVKFNIEHESTFKVGSKVEIWLKKGKYELIETIEILDNSPKITYQTTPVNHQVPTFYKFKIEGHRDTTQKVISLLNYKPGVVFDIAQLLKVSVLKNKKDKRSNNSYWVSSAVLSNSGTHELLFYFDDTRLSYKFCELNETISSEETITKELKPIIISNKGSISFNISSECDLTIRFGNLNSKNETIIQINFSVSDSEPIGVNTIIDKLILQNLSSKGIFEKVSVCSSWNLLHQIQTWLLEDSDNSYYPLLLGSDFQDEFRKPDWSTTAFMSSAELNIDCRPSRGVFQAPVELVCIRKNIIELLLSETEEDESHLNLLEYKELYTEKLAKELEEILPKYFELYCDWVSNSPEVALWFDVIAICEAKDGVIKNDPFALLLSPLHPIRLGWSFKAQNILYEALNKEMPCPGASILDSTCFPDAYSLPCYTTQGHHKFFNFLSIGNNSTIWGVLWRGDKLDLLQDQDIMSLFNSQFGIEIEGLDSGLSSSQIEHTLDDIFKIKSAQNAINVEVHSESTETEMFNKGVFNWVESNIGNDRIVNNVKHVRDLWFISGSRELRIFDARDSKYQPSPEELVDATNESGYKLSWYTVSGKDKEHNVDLTILSHLTNQSPTLIQADISSVIYRGAIVRERIRYSTFDTNRKLSFTESRIFTDRSLSNETDTYSIKYLDLICQIENEVKARKSSHLTSIPRLDFVRDKLAYSDYCAISSSVIDPSAFFDAEGNSFLWDYDLPNYSGRNSSKNGFYLLARDSDVVRDSIKKSLKNIPGLGNVGSDIVKKVLSEISGRGIPTLKTLASGGASANGEIGMLVAMNILQNFNPTDEKFELFPLRLDNTYNLLIPVDPFSSQLNTLCDRLHIDKKRPDLLSLSICLDNYREIKMVLLTPIEVKFRSSQIAIDKMILAHSQCDNLSNLYEKLLEKSLDSLLWDITRSKLISEMISFAFSTYGRRINDLEETKEWAILQSKVISQIIKKENVRFNSSGRLIVVSPQMSEFDKIKSNEESDTLKISFEDAKDLILGKNLNKFAKLGESVGNWGLIALNAARCDNQKVEGGNKNSSENSLDDFSEFEPKNLIEDTGDEALDIKSKEDSINEGIKFIVGHQIGALGEKAYTFYPSNTELNQLNMGIVGDLGTGKTQLIKALIYNLSKYPEQNRGVSPKFLIMDTKRDYDGSGDKQSDKNFVKSIGAKVVKPYKLPINLFDIRNSVDDHPALSKAEFFIDILKKIYGGIGPNQEDAILTAVIEAFEDRGYEPYQDDYKNFSSPTLRDIFEIYKKNLQGKKTDAPHSLMNKLVLAKLFEEDSTKTIDFKDFFDQTVVLSLGGIASNDRNLKMVMIIFMNIYREYMLGIRKYEFIKNGKTQLRKIDSFLLIDEANLIMEYELPVLEDLLLKGREFGMGVILSSQYLSHFRKSSTNYIEPLLTWFVHKIPNISVKELQVLGLTNADEGIVEKIKSLQCHYCLYKSLDSPGIIIKGLPHYILDNDN
jgi:DNA phosphorothioation-dependent restriction protein DptH